MSKEISLTGKVAKEYLKRFPKTPILTLAKKLYKENGKLFTGVEHARTILRNHAGLNGKKSRKEYTDRPLFREKTFNYNPFKIPETHAVGSSTWRLPKGYSKTLVISDVHIPYHTPQAIKAAVDYGVKRGCDSVFINGDLLDFYQLSFHEKDPRKTSIATELEMGRQFLDYLRDAFKGKPIYYIPANHEYRMERYLRVKAPELLDMQEFKIDVLLRCGEKGITYIDYGTKCYFGKLLVEHGDKLRGSGGVNPARTLALKFKRSTLCGHFHRTTTNNLSVYDDDGFMCWSTGCLCELEPNYMPVNEHNHGAAIIETNHADNTFRVENFMIIKGKVY